MKQRYRVLLPLTVHTADGAYTQGDVFEMDHTPEQERELLGWRGGGMLEIVPRKFRVVGTSKVHETNPGDTFTKALTLGEEELLVAGGHIERVETPSKKEVK